MFHLQEIIGFCRRIYVRAHIEAGLYIMTRLCTISWGEFTSMLEIADVALLYIYRIMQRTLY